MQVLRTDIVPSQTQIHDHQTDGHNDPPLQTVGKQLNQAAAQGPVKPEINIAAQGAEAEYLLTFDQVGEKSVEDKHNPADMAEQSNESGSELRRVLSTRSDSEGHGCRAWKVDFQILGRPCEHCGMAGLICP